MGLNRCGDALDLERALDLIETKNKLILKMQDDYDELEEEYGTLQEIKEGLEDTNAELQYENTELVNTMNRIKEKVKIILDLA